MHLLWGIVVELFTEPYNFESVESASETVIFDWETPLSFANNFHFSFSLLYTCMCATLLATFHCVTTTIFITCKFHRMSHAQHRNLKAFKWFAGHVVCNVAPWRQARSHHQSKPRCHAISPLLFVVVAKVARALFALSLAFNFLSLFSLRFSLTWMGFRKKFFCIKKPSRSLSLSRVRKYSLARPKEEL